ncbi:hypothetical protein Pcinc_036627, partial [Petrolisthes cinctipes]
WSPSLHSSFVFWYWEPRGHSRCNSLVQRETPREGREYTPSPSGHPEDTGGGAWCLAWLGVPEWRALGEPVLPPPTD